MPLAVWLFSFVARRWRVMRRGLIGWRSGWLRRFLGKGGDVVQFGAGDDVAVMDAFLDGFLVDLFGSGVFPRPTPAPDWAWAVENLIRYRLSTKIFGVPVVKSRLSTENSAIIALVLLGRFTQAGSKVDTRIVTRYSRQDVLRILQISARQLQGWERAGLISSTEAYGFAELAQLHTLRDLQHMRMRPRSIRASVEAMQAASGMTNPLLESKVRRTGARLVFRHSGVVLDPIRQQFVFDFEAAASGPAPVTVSMLSSTLVAGQAATARERELQRLFVQAVQAEEQAKKSAAMELYRQILGTNPQYTAALINLGTLHYHRKEYAEAESLYRRATEADPSYVLAFFDLGNVLDELQRPDESIEAYSRALKLVPRYADAHYNLALAYERKGERRRALMHWQAYVRLDKRGPWAEHARGQIRKLLSREKLTIAYRGTGSAAYTPAAVLVLVEREAALSEPVA